MKKILPLLMLVLFSAMVIAQTNIPDGAQYVLKKTYYRDVQSTGKIQEYESNSWKNTNFKHFYDIPQYNKDSGWLVTNGWIETEREKYTFFDSQSKENGFSDLPKWEYDIIKRNDVGNKEGGWNKNGDVLTRIEERESGDNYDYFKYTIQGDVYSIVSAEHVGTETIVKVSSVTYGDNNRVSGKIESFVTYNDKDGEIGKKDDKLPDGNGYATIFKQGDVVSIRTVQEGATPGSGKNLWNLKAFPSGPGYGPVEAYVTRTGETYEEKIYTSTGLLIAYSQGSDANSLTSSRYAVPYKQLSAGGPYIINYEQLNMDANDPNNPNAQYAADAVNAYQTRAWWSGFADIVSSSTAYSGLSSILLGSEAMTEWRRGVEGFFSDAMLGTQYWVSAICESELDSTPSTIALTEQYGQTTVAAHVEGERTKPISFEFYNETTGKTQKVTKYIYKLSYYFRNPSDSPGNIDFNVFVQGPSGTVALYIDPYTLAPGQDISASGDSMVVQYSVNEYNRICISHSGATIITGRGNSRQEMPNPFCNSIVTVTGNPGSYGSGGSSGNNQI